MCQFPVDIDGQQYQVQITKKAMDDIKTLSRTRRGQPDETTIIQEITRTKIDNETNIKIDMVDVGAYALQIYLS